MEPNAQYETEHRLLARRSVWREDAHGPIAFAVAAIAARRPRRVLVGGIRLELAFDRDSGAENPPALVRPGRAARLHHAGSLSEAIPVPDDLEPLEAHGEPAVFLATP
jgi:hypothetical protein